MHQKPYPRGTVAEDVTICHTGNQGAKAVVKVSEMHLASSQGGRETQGRTRERERERERGSSESLGFSAEPGARAYKAAVQPGKKLGPWRIRLGQQIPEPQGQCEPLLERGDVSALVTVPAPR